MKSFFLILIFIFNTSLLAADSKKSPYLTKEPTHYLIPKEDYKGGSIVLYLKPSKGSAIFKKVKVKDNKGETFKDFDDKKHPFPAQVISSTEKRGEFYKVFYKDRYAWVKEGDFKKGLGLFDFFRKVAEVGLIFNIVKTPIFNIDGKKPISNIGLKDFYHKKYSEKNYDGEMKIIKMEVEDNKFWIFGEVCRFPISLVQGQLCYNSSHIWIRPFSDSGEITVWSYPHNEIAF